MNDFRNDVGMYACHVENSRVEWKCGRDFAKVLKSKLTANNSEVN